ncbi:MAG TPA: hypothetical protein VIY48_17490 [Candidatus Paceibacterota bacterium]
MPSNELVPRGTDVPSDLHMQMEMAKAYAAADVLPRHLQGKPANLLIILAGARALNVPAFWAVQSMHVIDGKLSMSADLMRALAILAGHKVRVIEDRKAGSATVQVVRKDDPDFIGAVTFTMEDAKRAELLGKTNWKKFGPAMLIARATTMAIRTYCPEVLFGVVYSPDELGAITDESGEVIEGEIAEEQHASPAQKDNGASVLFDKSLEDAIDTILGTEKILDAASIYATSVAKFGEETCDVSRYSVVSAWHDRLASTINFVNSITEEDDWGVPNSKEAQELLRLCWRAASGTKAGGITFLDRVVSENLTFKQFILQEISALEKRPVRPAEDNDDAIQMLKDGGIDVEVVEFVPSNNTDDAAAIRREAGLDG